MNKKIKKKTFSKKEFTNKEINFVLTKAIENFRENVLLGMEPKNTVSLRRVLFFKNFLSNKGNATKSAIASGYSPKSAKQQGYRTLKWIQKQSRLKSK